MESLNMKTKIEDSITEEEKEKLKTLKGLTTEKINTMSENELDMVIGELTKQIPQEIIDENVRIQEQVDSTEDQLVEGKIEDVLCNPDGSVKRVTSDKESIKESNLNILEVLDNKLDDEKKDILIGSSIQKATDKFNLSDEEAIAFSSIILRCKSGEKFNVYNELPESIQEAIRKTAFENSIPTAEYNNLAKYIINDFISECDTDEVFVDFEKSMKEAMDISGLSDLYLDHTKEIMTTKINTLADSIEEEDHEKAKTLRTISEKFDDSYKFNFLRESYLNNARVRKAVRRDCDKVERYCEDFNYKNDKSIFKMSDCGMMRAGLYKCLLGEDDLSITPIDLDKFIILFCKSCENLDANDVVDASFMYYSMKNIVMLNNTNETKTSFASEIINNIKEMISFIKEQEAEFSNKKD